MPKKNSNRKHERLGALVLVTVYTLKDASQTYRAALIDISIGGAAFETQADFTIDDNIIIRMVYKEKLLVIIEATIKRKANCIGGLQYGVEFTHVSSKDKKFLKKMLYDIKQNP